MKAPKGGRIGLGKQAKKMAPANMQMLDLSRLTPRGARDILNDEIAFRQYAGLSGVSPGELLNALLNKFPSVPINKQLFRYLRNK